MKMHEYNRALDLHKLRLLQQEHSAAAGLRSLERRDMLADIGLIDANYNFLVQEAGFQALEHGRIGRLSQSRIREMTAMRDAEWDLGRAQLGEYRADLTRQRNVYAAQATLEQMQSADLDRAFGLGMATIGARRSVLGLERGVLGARTAQIGTARARVGEETRLAMAQADVATAEGQAVAAQRAFLEPTRMAQRRTLAAQQAVVGGEAALQAVGARQRLAERRSQLEGEVGTARAAEAVRGVSGSFSAVRAAEAEQRYRRDVERFQLEDEVAELKLAQTSAQIGERQLAVEREHAGQVTALGTAAARARAAGQGARVSMARARESAAGLDVESAQVQVGLGQLEVKAAELNQTQESLRSQTAQGQQQIAIRAADREGRQAMLTAAGQVADRRQQLLRAQRGAATERIGRERIETQSALGRAALSERRSLLQAREARRQRGRKQLDMAQLDSQHRLEGLAATVVDWQVENLPSTKEYRGGGGPSGMSIFLQGLTTLLG